MSSVLPKITLGCDPELFLKNKDTGKFVFPIDSNGKPLIPGTKQEPYKVPGGAIQIDGAALEFNINPVSSVKEWSENINKVREYLLNSIPSNLELVTTPYVEFDKEYFDSIPKEAKILGCEPDFNAYDEGKPNPRPNGDSLARVAGGHVHIGWTKNKKLDDKDHLEDCTEVVKQLDFYLGVPSLVWDEDNRRRKMYGTPGCFRPKPYGVEYRTLSNMWLVHPAFTKFVFESSIAAVQDLFEQNVMRVKIGSNWAKSIIEAGHLSYPTDVLNIIKNNSIRVTKIGYKEIKDTANLIKNPEKYMAPNVRDNFISIKNIQVMAADPQPPLIVWRGVPINRLDLRDLQRAKNEFAIVGAIEALNEAKRLERHLINRQANGF